jgi:serine/threonine-protein kinase HipA
MTDVLDARLGDKPVGKLTLLTGERSFFAFEEAYLNDPQRPLLSQSFITLSGDLIAENRDKFILSPIFS